MRERGAGRKGPAPLAAAAASALPAAPGAPPWTAAVDSRGKRISTRRVAGLHGDGDATDLILPMIDFCTVALTPIAAIDESATAAARTGPRT